MQDLTEVAAPPVATSFMHVEDRSRSGHSVLYQSHDCDDISQFYVSSMQHVVVCRSKEKKSKVYAKDTETVTSSPQPRVSVFGFFVRLE